MQPVHIQNSQGGRNQAAVIVDQKGKQTLLAGSLDFYERGIIRRLADIVDFTDRTHSMILFGIRNRKQNWSIFYGNGWDTMRYENARFVMEENGDSGLLTVFDSQAGQDRKATVSVNAGTLTYRGASANRIYRVIGGSGLFEPVESN